MTLPAGTGADDADIADVDRHGANLASPFERRLGEAPSSRDRHVAGRHRAGVRRRKRPGERGSGPSRRMPTDPSAVDVALLDEAPPLAQVHSRERLAADRERRPLDDLHERAHAPRPPRAPANEECLDVVGDVLRRSAPSCRGRAPRRGTQRCAIRLPRTALPGDGKGKTRRSSDWRVTETSKRCWWQWRRRWPAPRGPPDRPHRSPPGMKSSRAVTHLSPRRNSQRLFSASVSFVHGASLACCFGVLIAAWPMPDARADEGEAPPALPLDPRRYELAGFPIVGGNSDIGVQFGGAATLDALLRRRPSVPLEHRPAALGER